MAYPGTDPDALTIAVFTALLNRAARSKAILNGGGEDCERIERAALDNQRIIVAARFPALFPPEPEE